MALPSARVESLDALFNKTAPDETLATGISRDTVVGLFTEPYLSPYKQIADAYLTGEKVLDIRLPDILKGPWTAMVRNWQTFTGVHVNGFAEPGRFLRYEFHDLLWVPEDSARSYKIPRYSPPLSSLARAAHVLFVCQMQEELASIRQERKGNPVKPWEIDRATYQGDAEQLQRLSKAMMAMGQSNGLSIWAIYHHPFGAEAVPSIVLKPKDESEFPEEAKKFWARGENRNTGFRPRVIATFTISK